MDMLLVELTSVLITPGPICGLWMMVLYFDDVHLLLLYSQGFYIVVALLADVLYDLSDCLAAGAGAHWRSAGAAS